MRLSLTLLWPWRLCYGWWWKPPFLLGRPMHTAWAILGPLALCLRMPRWAGDRR